MKQVGEDEKRLRPKMALDEPNSSREKLALVGRGVLCTMRSVPGDLWLPAVSCAMLRLSMA